MNLSNESYNVIINSPCIHINEHMLRLIALIIDGSAKGGLTQLWELFTMIHCVLKYLKR